MVRGDSSLHLTRESGIVVRGEGTYTLPLVATATMWECLMKLCQGFMVVILVVYGCNVRGLWL